jgi:serine/threonine protein kinase
MKSELAAYTELSKYPDCKQGITCILGSYIGPKYGYMIFPLMDGDLKKFRSLLTELPTGDSVGHLINQMVTSLSYGLYYMHSHGFVHRDIKPENCLYKTARPPQKTHVFELTDLGSVCSSVRIPSKTMKCIGKQWIRSMLYLPPELVEKSLKYQSGTLLPEDFRKGDVWALGLTFFETINGKFPFAHPNNPAGFALHVKNLAQKDVERSTFNISSEFMPAAVINEIIDGMLKVNPAERWSMERVIHRLVAPTSLSDRCN